MFVPGCQADAGSSAGVRSVPTWAPGSEAATGRGQRRASASAIALTWRGTLDESLGSREPVEHGLVVPGDPTRLHAFGVLLPASLPGLLSHDPVQVWPLHV